MAFEEAVVDTLRIKCERALDAAGCDTLVIAGGLGNFIDRLRQGFVVDMFHLDFMNFAIFNVADSYLTVGVFLLLILMLKEETHGN